MFKTLFFLSLVVIYSCTSRSNIVSPKQNVPIQWQYLNLEFNDTAIHLVQFMDTLELTVFKHEVQKFQINKIEKDSLFILVNELINFKEQPRTFCTDYVGKLKVRVRYNSQLLKEVTFSSICDWRELNETTYKIEALLKNYWR